MTSGGRSASSAAAARRSAYRAGHARLVGPCGGPRLGRLRQRPGRAGSGRRDRRRLHGRARRRSRAPAAEGHRGWPRRRRPGHDAATNRSARRRCVYGRSPMPISTCASTCTPTAVDELRRVWRGYKLYEATIATAAAIRAMRAAGRVRRSASRRRRRNDLLDHRALPAHRPAGPRHHHLLDGRRRALRGLRADVGICKTPGLPNRTTIRWASSCWRRATRRRT